MSEQTKDPGRMTEEERRDSPRVPMRFLVRRQGAVGDFEAREGNLSLGGLAWSGGHPEVGTRLEVRFLLPGGKDEVQVLGEVLSVREGQEGSSVHVRFIDLPMETEMSIARYLDDLELAESNSGNPA
jgi:uncharacterized protein (TIGR02266 family)